MLTRGCYPPAAMGATDWDKQQCSVMRFGLLNGSVGSAGGMENRMRGWAVRRHLQNQQSTARAPAKNHGNHWWKTEMEERKREREGQRG